MSIGILLIKSNKMYGNNYNILDNITLRLFLFNLLIINTQIGNLLFYIYYIIYLQKRIHFFILYIIYITL